MDDSASRPATAEEFRIEEGLSRGGTVVLTVGGDVDLHVAGEFKSRLTETVDGGASMLVLDLSSVTFVDSMGLGVLLGGKQRLAAQGGELHLVVPGPEVRRILEITRLDQILPLHETLPDALAAVGYQD
jgi:anti-sigma B factor antagonist